MLGWKAKKELSYERLLVSALSSRPVAVPHMAVESENSLGELAKDYRFLGLFNENPWNRTQKSIFYSTLYESDVEH